MITPEPLSRAVSVSLAAVEIYGSLMAEGWVGEGDELWLIKWLLLSIVTEVWKKRQIVLGTLAAELENSHWHKDKGQ